VKAALPLVAVLLLAGCGGGSDGDGPVPGGEAVERGTDEPQLVSGYVIERDGVPRLCEAILESFPPQCGEPSLRLVGSVAAPPEEQVTLLGRVDGDAFVVVSER
jgi:hypothetical protein